MTSPDGQSNGVYLGMDGAVHAVDEAQQQYYSDLSLWDVYRCQVTPPISSFLLSSFASSLPPD